MSLDKVKIVPGIGIFVGVFIVTVIALSLFRVIENKYLLALVYSVLILILLKVLSMFSNLSKVPLSSGPNMTRYTMLCHNCNWEWMSNTTEKESPTKCPNCGEKSKLEVVGYRKVQKFQKKSEKELTSFFVEK